MDIKSKRADRIRKELLSFVFYLFIPTMILLLYGKVIGNTWFYSEVGQIVAFFIVIIITSLFISLYKSLFPKYSDDLQEY